MNASALRLGIDVGGTNTDAVLMTGRTVIATNKSFTTRDVMSGVIESVARLLDKSGAAPGDISHVMIGTTQFINAFVQRRDLVPTAIVRAALPRADGVPPLIDWPDDLIAAIGDHAFEIHGGAQYDGSLYAELDDAELMRVVAEIRARDIQSVAVCATHAPLRPDIEERVAATITAACPHVLVTCSAAVGGLGFVDRENAAIINASLAPLAKRVVAALEQAFVTLGFRASIFLSQNDGTLITTEEAARHPVFTCSAGPTNSIRGAAFLSGIKDAVVVDVGGTTTDVGHVARGFPRETALPNVIGGVRTNMRMPDVLSIALGGGTHVALGERPAIGPESAGHRLKDEALIFGSARLTASDVAVAAGNAVIGDPALVAHLPPHEVALAMQRMAAIVEEAIDRVKTNAALVPAIVVGGGNILLPPQLEGAGEIVRPDHAAVANAVGAAIATVSGRVDRLYDIASLGREGALAQAKADAIAAALTNGADPDTIEIVEIVELPMTHIKTDYTQIKARASGELRALQHA